MKDYEAAIAKVVDPASMLPDIPNDKIWLMMGELNEILEDFERELAIAYISCNHSGSKHLCQTILRGKTDEHIIEVMISVRTSMEEELRSRRKKKE